MRHNVTSVGTTQQDNDKCQLDSFYGVSLTDGLSGGAVEPRCRSCPFLNNQTTYDLYVVAEDDNGQTAYFRTNNIQAAPTMITVFMVGRG